MRCRAGGKKSTACCTRMRVTAVAVVATSALVGCGHSSRQEPKLQSNSVSASLIRPGAILFARLSGSNFHSDSGAELYSMHEDGSSVQRLTFNNAHDSYPAWSPDGQEIAFVSDRDNPHLRGRRMTRADGSLGPQMGMDIYVMRADGSNLRRVTRDTASTFIGPQAWGRDGTTLLIDSWVDGDAEILLTRLDGTIIRELTDNTAWDGDAGWSPDGQRIVFRSDRGGKGALYTMHADGSGVVQLTPPGEVAMHPAWSPDGTRLAYASRADTTTDIVVINADGSGHRRLTDDPANDLWPTWSPDGQQIAFQTMRDGDAELYAMDADGSNLRRLTRNPTGDVGPAWGPMISGMR